MSISKEQILEMLPSYVLGALESEEMIAVDAYLDEQKELLHQVQVAEDALGLMALATPPVRPPVVIKDTLMQRVEHDAVRRRHSTLIPAPPSAQRKEETGATRWQMPSLVRTMVAVAAVVILAALSIYNTLLSRQLTTLVLQNQEQAAAIASLEVQNADYGAIVDDLHSDIAQLQSERDLLVEQTTQLAGRSAALDAQIQEISNELSVDQGRLQLLSTANEAVMLSEGDAAPQSRGAFYVSGLQGVLIVHGLQPLPESQIYQFWWVTEDGTQLPVAPIEVHADVEPTWAIFDVPEQAPAFSIVGLTIEPVGGSSQPTGPMVLEGSITG